MMQKVHKSAICIVPPRAVWQQLQDIRCFKDKSFVRWPPHVNLLYPFWDDSGSNFEVAAQRCAAALRGFSSFQVMLESLSFFEHGRSCTLWVDPGQELCKVQAALVAAFPECTDLSDDPGRGITRFTPHLSLGQWRDRAAAAEAVQRYGAAWQPLRFQAEAVALISRQGFDDPFTLRYVVPFGGAPPRRMDQPYVATVGPFLLPNGGEGSEEQTPGPPAAPGIWNFAYGANMCPAKLEGARGLTPLESLPAQLPGWRLSFTHRGGMGNLVPLAQGEAGPHVHGVLHRLSPADYARLACMEHEYRPEEVEVVRYDGRGTERAVVFVTPAECRIQEGLPPPTRYLDLLKEGARHWGLEGGYAQWLGSLEGIDGRQRGDAYYSTPQGAPLPALPKIRTGSQQRQRGGGGRGGGGRDRRRGGRQERQLQA